MISHVARYIQDSDTCFCSIPETDPAMAILYQIAQATEPGEQKQVLTQGTKCLDYVTKY